MTNPVRDAESSTATTDAPPDPTTPAAGLIEQLRGSGRWDQAVQRLRAVSDGGADVERALVDVSSDTVFSDTASTDAEDEFSDDEGAEDVAENEATVPASARPAALGVFAEFHQALSQCAADADKVVGGRRPKKIIARARARYHALAFVADIQLLIHPDRGPNGAARDLITRLGTCETVVGLCRANGLGPFSEPALAMLRQCEVTEPTSHTPEKHDILRKLKDKLDHAQMRFMQLAGREWADELGPRSGAANVQTYDTEFARRTASVMHMALHIANDPSAAPARRQGNKVALGVLADALALVLDIAPEAAADLARSMLPSPYDPQAYGVVHDIAVDFILGQLASPKTQG